MHRAFCPRDSAESKSLQDSMLAASKLQGKQMTTMLEPAALPGAHQSFSQAIHKLGQHTRWFVLGNMMLPLEEFNAIFDDDKNATYYKQPQARCKI